MGSELKRKQAAAFKKRLDHSLVALGSSDLFTQTPTRAARVIAGEIVGIPNVQVGEPLVIQQKGEGLVILQGLTEIATLSNPPQEVIKFVEASFGIAKGVVETVHSEAGVLEISVC